MAKGTRKALLTGLAALVIGASPIQAEEPVNPLDFGFGTEYLGSNPDGTHNWRTNVTNLTQEASSDFEILQIELDGKIVETYGVTTTKQWDLLSYENEQPNPKDNHFIVGTGSPDEYIKPQLFLPPNPALRSMGIVYTTPADQDTLGLVDMTVQSDGAGALTKQGVGPVKVKPFSLFIDSNDLTVSNLTHGVAYKIEESPDLAFTNATEFASFTATGTETNFPYSATNSKSFFRGKVE